MGKNLLSETTVKTKNNFKLPKGATVIQKTERMYIEEIENGYLISKSYELKWQDVEGETHWENFDKKWYSEESPVTVVEPKDIGFLADNF